MFMCSSKYISHETTVQNMLGSWDWGASHPNEARRLLNIFERKGKPFLPPSQLLTTAKVALIAGAHLALFATGSYQLYQSL